MKKEWGEYINENFCKELNDILIPYNIEINCLGNIWYNNKIWYEADYYIELQNVINYLVDKSK